MKCYLYTFGCKVNQYETQVLRERLAAEGHEIVSRIEEAEKILVNSCTVTGESDRQCRQLIRQAMRKNPAARVVVTGCYAVRAPRELEDLFPGVDVAAEKERLAGARTSPITGFSGHARAFVKVQDGCDAFCSYCIVPYVRPRLWSRGGDDVLGELRTLVDKGCPEIVLSGVRLGRYEGGLARLLEKIAALPGSFRVRLSSIEIREVDAGLLDCMRSRPDRICAHLHVPLQSGSDAVLRRMNRPYSTGEFSERLAAIAETLPDAGISTDVIVGFPGETEEEFSRTYEFIVRARFSRLHVFTYSVRSGTAAATFSGHVPRSTAGERSRRLTALDARLQEGFWRRFTGTCRSAVREGKKNTVLTDNYIRLNVDHGLPAHSGGIMRVRLEEREGRPWGIPV